MDNLREHLSAASTGSRHPISIIFAMEVECARQFIQATPLSETFTGSGDIQLNAVLAPLVHQQP